MSEEREKELKSVKESVSDMLKDTDTLLRELREDVKVLRQAVDKTVTERPLLALGVAFVAGLSLGVALSRSKD